MYAFQRPLSNLPHHAERARLHGCDVVRSLAPLHASDIGKGWLQRGLLAGGREFPAARQYRAAVGLRASGYGWGWFRILADLGEAFCEKQRGQPDNSIPAARGPIFRRETTLGWGIAAASREASQRSVVSVYWIGRS